MTVFGFWEPHDWKGAGMPGPLCLLPAGWWLNSRAARGKSASAPGGHREAGSQSGSEASPSLGEHPTRLCIEQKCTKIKTKIIGLIEHDTGCRTAKTNGVIYNLSAVRRPAAPWRAGRSLTMQTSSRVRARILHAA